MPDAGATRASRPRRESRPPAPDRDDPRLGPPVPVDIDLPDPDDPPYETRPRHSRGEVVPTLGNEHLARIFFEIGDMMELKGELPFKAGAYRRAADSIAHSAVDIVRAYRQGAPPTMVGVGKAIDEKLAELADTGRMRFYERLRREIPPSLVSLLNVPGLGPRMVAELWSKLRIENLADLEAAARDGRLRKVRGINERTEQRILDGLRELEERPPERMRLGTATEIADRLAAVLEAGPEPRRVFIAGSLRRRRETVGDLDLLVESNDPRGVIERLATHPAVDRVGGRGSTRATLRLLRGPRVDVMVMPPGRAGTYLVHFTGSAAHNVRLRDRARDRGWSLSQYGFAPLPRDGDDPGDMADITVEATVEPAEVRTFETEAEVYDFLGLPFIEPELREDRGEIEAAVAGRLPDLIDLQSIAGDCHTHSDWSDGHVSIEKMAETGRRRGYRYQVLTDHSRSLTIARGLTPERVEEQRPIIAALNERFEREEAQGRLPKGAHPDGFRLLHGCEMEITVDGKLDYPDSLLKRYDVVVASLHVGRRQPRKQLMERYLTALRSPHVDIIAHPSGRKIGIREDLDLDWEQFYRVAAETGTILEINGSDERLDLDDRRARVARDAGCMVSIDSDAHYLGEFENMGWGVSLARRAWIEKRDVVNALPRDEFLKLIAEKPHRV
jgi:DNA polymerase (family 10)